MSYWILVMVMAALPNTQAVIPIQFHSYAECARAAETAIQNTRWLADASTGPAGWYCVPSDPYGNDKNRDLNDPLLRSSP